MTFENRELTNNLWCAHITHHVQEHIIEGANAQVIVQDIFAIKLNSALNAKENEKADDRTKLFPGGKGQHLTCEDFIQQKKAPLTKEKEDEEAARVERQKARGRKKSLKDALEKLRKTRKEEHEKAVAEWNEECKKLTNEGAKKDLPKIVALIFSHLCQGTGNGSFGLT
jgi:hypothetical protein